MEKVIGIYKITSPSGRIYIGQSVDIYKRFYQYSKIKNCKSQIKLYNSFLKHGLDKHIFEIVCICDKIELNEKERYFQDLYSVLENGLNCLLTQTNDKVRLLSNECELKRRDSIRKYRIGKKHKDSTIQLYKDTRKGIAVSENTKLKISEKLTGLKRTIETKSKMSISQKGIKRSVSHLTIHNTKIIIDFNTGIFYNGIKEAALYNKINCNTLKGILNGNNKNNKGLNLSYV